MSREVRKQSKIAVKSSAPAASKPPMVPEAPVKSKAPLTLAERLEKLKGKVQKKEKAPQKALVLDSTLPLLKLPKRRAQLGTTDGPADLDDIDPTLGAWLPSSTLSQQLSEVQQHLRERKEKALPQASDKNPEARAPQQREKLRLELDAQQEAEDEGDGVWNVHHEENQYEFYSIQYCIILCLFSILLHYTLSSFALSYHIINIVILYYILLYHIIP